MERGKQSKMLVTVTEGLAATDEGSFFNQQAWLEKYTYGEGLYYKGEHSDSSDFGSDVESSCGESNSDTDYFEEPLKNNKKIKIDYSNKLHVGLARTFKTECNRKECTKNSIRMTLKMDAVIK